jgi:LPS export ABC transporter protein LptC
LLVQGRRPGGSGRPRLRGGLVALLCASAVGLGCSSGLEALEVPRHEPKDLPPALLQGVIFEGYRGEQREVKVTAERATIDLIARIANLDDVTLRFTEDSRGQIEVAAPSGQLKLDEDDFVLSGGVSGSAQKGELFTTESVRYVAKSRQMVSTTPVELHRENLDLRADGMTLGLDERHLRLVGNVEARVVPR